ncbi:MAG: hypothetical protein ACYC6M_15260 [Terriglobales bacterium]
MSGVAGLGVLVGVADWSGVGGVELCPLGLAVVLLGFVLLGLVLLGLVLLGLVEL